MDAQAQVATCLLMLVFSIPLHESGHYAAARLLGYDSVVRLVFSERDSGFWTVSTRLYKIRDTRDLERAIRESLGITACGALGILSPLAFLAFDHEAWYFFAFYATLLLAYACYEVGLTARSWRYERMGEYAALWWAEGQMGLADDDLVRVELHA